MVSTSASSASSARSSPTLTKTPTSPPRNTNILECDYDVNPTYLYQAIEAKQWQHCKTFLEQSEKAHAQAATWVIRKERDGKLRWRLLPLHAAVIFGSPLEILELLLGEYPAAAQSKDDQGMLPLHLSFRNFSSWDILEELLTAYPLAISIKDRRGRTPLACACSAFRKQASVLELYTHVAVTAEKQALQRQQKLAVEARIGALQETHIQTLEQLKQDWQERSLELEQELEEQQTKFSELQKRHETAVMELNNKTDLEQQLTLKLTQVTQALRQVSESRAQEEQAGDVRLMELQEQNRNLLLVTQQLMEQQTALQLKLDQYAVVCKEVATKKRAQWLEWATLDAERDEVALQELQQIGTSLQSSHKDAATRLSRLLKSKAIIKDETAGADVSKTVGAQATLTTGAADGPPAEVTVPSKAPPIQVPSKEPPAQVPSKEPPAAVPPAPPTAAPPTVLVPPTPPTTPMLISSKSAAPPLKKDHLKKKSIPSVKKAAPLDEDSIVDEKVDSINGGVKEKAATPKVA